MKKHRIEVADVFRQFGDEYLESHRNSTSCDQKRVLRNIVDCRTPVLGGHKIKCDHCGYEEIAYHSCRDRHCPKCQANAGAKWLEDRAEDLLNVEYFHLVFTLPNKIGFIAHQNKRVVYGILFRSVSDTLLTIARDPKHLGAQIGFLAVLHTWGSNLHHHPHLHCIAPSGGISPDGTRWVSCKRRRKAFFLSVRVLSRMFRGKFLDLLRRAYLKGKLTFHGDLQDLADRRRFDRYLKAASQTDWVVYAKRPFGSPLLVLKYLARYTHRVAISNQRLVDLKDRKVRFHWKNYANGNTKKTMTLDVIEFIRRFLLHVFPKGFVRIRHYGFLANCVRRQKVALCQRLLGGIEDNTNCSTASVVTDKDHSQICPECKKGTLAVVSDIAPDMDGRRRFLDRCPIVFDTS